MYNRIYLLVCFFLTLLYPYEPPHYIEFNGVDSYVVIPDDSLIDLTGSFTIEMWISSDINNQYSHLINKHQPGINDDGSWVLKQKRLKEMWAMGFSWPYGSNSEAFSIYGVPEFQQWHHIALTYNDMDYKLEFWVDGESKFKKTIELGILNTDWDVYIGSEVTYNFFKGTLSEIRFSNISRYNYEFTPPPEYHADKFTIAYYPCNIIRNDSLIDISRNRLHGSIHNVKFVSDLKHGSQTGLYIIGLIFSFVVLTTIYLNINTKSKKHHVVLGKDSKYFEINGKKYFPKDLRLKNSFDLLLMLFNTPSLILDHEDIHKKLWECTTDGSFRNSLYVVMNDIRKNIPEMAENIHSQKNQVIISNNDIFMVEKNNM